MDDLLRRRLWRVLEALPEARVLEVLDFAEFLQARERAQPLPAASFWEAFGERWRDRMRQRGVPPWVAREALTWVARLERWVGGPRG
jgi:hypothetical protein